MTDHFLSHAPAVDKAERFITDAISGGRFESGAWLPAIDALSAAAGVSRMSMWKAVRRLRSRGVLTGARGQCVAAQDVGGRKDDRPGMRSAALTLEPAGGRLWQRIASVIHRDVLLGRFAAGSRLPSIKELTFRYHASHPTIRRACADLEKRGIIKRSLRGFVIPSMATGRASRRIVFFGFGPGPGELYLGDHHREMLRHLETECARARMKLDVIAFHERDGDYACTEWGSSAPRHLSDSDDVAGYMAHVIGAEGIPDPIVDFVVSTKKPCAIHDSFREWEYPASLARSPMSRIFTAATGTVAGDAIGRFLLSLGHVKAAYISPVHGELWSVQRLTGIRMVFEAAGHRGGIVDCCINVDRRDALAEVERRGAFKPFDAFFRRWFTQVPIAYAQTFRPHVTTLRVQEAVYAQLRHLLQPEFERLAADPSITAWVAANDGFAAMAMDFLGQRKIDVPGRISVIGFDNSFTAQNRHITSYDFDIPALSSAMLNYILRPREFPVRERREVWSFEGTVVERQSTKRVRRRVA